MALDRPFVGNVFLFQDNYAPLVPKPFVLRNNTNGKAEDDFDFLEVEAREAKKDPHQVSPADWTELAWQEAAHKPTVFKKKVEEYVNNEIKKILDDIAANRPVEEFSEANLPSILDAVEKYYPEVYNDLLARVYTELGQSSNSEKQKKWFSGSALFYQIKQGLAAGSDWHGMHEYAQMMLKYVIADKGKTEWHSLKYVLELLISVAREGQEHSESWAWLNQFHSLQEFKKLTPDQTSTLEGWLTNARAERMLGIVRQRSVAVDGVLLDRQQKVRRALQGEDGKTFDPKKFLECLLEVDTDPTLYPVLSLSDQKLGASYAVEEAKRISKQPWNKERVHFLTEILLVSVLAERRNYLPKYSSLNPAMHEPMVDMHQAIYGLQWQRRGMAGYETSPEGLALGRIFRRLLKEYGSIQGMYTQFFNSDMERFYTFMMSMSGFDQYQIQAMMRDFYPLIQRHPKFIKKYDDFKENMKLKHMFYVDIKQEGKAHPDRHRISLHDSSGNIQALLKEQGDFKSLEQRKRIVHDIFEGVRRNAPLQRIIDEALRFARDGYLGPANTVLEKVLSSQNSYYLSMDKTQLKGKRQEFREAVDSAYYTKYGRTVYNQAELCASEKRCISAYNRGQAGWAGDLSNYIQSLERGYKANAPTMATLETDGPVNKALSLAMQAISIESQRSPHDFAMECVSRGYFGPAEIYSRLLPPAEKLAFLKRMYYVTAHEAPLQCLKKQGSKIDKKVEKTLLELQKNRLTDQEIELSLSLASLPNPDANPFFAEQAVEAARGAHKVLNQGPLASSFRYKDKEISARPSEKEVKQFIDKILKKTDKDIYDFINELKKCPNPLVRARVVTYLNKHWSANFWVAIFLANDPAARSLISKTDQTKFDDNLINLVPQYIRHAKDATGEAELGILLDALSHSIINLAGAKETLPNEQDDKRTLELAVWFNRVQQELQKINPQHEIGKNFYRVETALRGVEVRLSLSFFSNIDGTRQVLPVSISHDELFERMQQQGLSYEAMDLLLVNHLKLNFQMGGGWVTAYELAIRAAEKGFTTPAHELVTLLETVAIDSLDYDLSQIHEDPRFYSIGFSQSQKFASELFKRLKELHPSDHLSFIIDNVKAEVNRRASEKYYKELQVKAVGMVSAVAGFFFSGWMLNQCRERYVQRFNEQQERRVVEERRQRQEEKEKQAKEEAQRKVAAEAAQQLAQQEKNAEEAYQRLLKENIPSLNTSLEEAEENLKKKLAEMRERLVHRLTFTQAYRPITEEERKQFARKCKTPDAGYEAAARFVRTGGECSVGIENVRQSLAEVLSFEGTWSKKKEHLEMFLTNYPKILSQVKKTLEEKQTNFNKKFNEEEERHTHRLTVIKDVLEGTLGRNTLPLILEVFNVGCSQYWLLLNEEQISQALLTFHATNIYTTEVKQKSTEPSAAAPAAAPAPAPAPASASASASAPSRVVVPHAAVYDRRLLDQADAAYRATQASAGQQIGRERQEADVQRRYKKSIQENLFCQAVWHDLEQMKKIAEVHRKICKPGRFEEDFLLRRQAYLGMRALTALLAASKGEESIVKGSKPNIAAVDLLDEFNSDEALTVRDVLRHTPWIPVGIESPWFNVLTKRLCTFSAMWEGDRKAIKLLPEGDKGINLSSTLSTFAKDQAIEELPLEVAKQLIVRELEFIAELQKRNQGRDMFTPAEEQALHGSIHCIVQLASHKRIKKCLSKECLVAFVNANQNLGHAFLPPDYQSSEKKTCLKRYELNLGKYVTKHEIGDSVGPFDTSHPITKEMRNNLLYKILPNLPEMLETLPDTALAAAAATSPATRREGKVSAAEAAFS